MVVKLIQYKVSGINAAFVQTLITARNVKLRNNTVILCLRSEKLNTLLLFLNVHTREFQPRKKTEILDNPLN